MVAIAVSDVESETDSEDENKVYSKLTRPELIDFVKELISHYQTKSKELKSLLERYIKLLREHERTLLDMENIEDENKYFKQLTDKWSKKPLSEQHTSLQEFTLTGIARSNVASMIYNVRRNQGEGIGFTKEFGKTKATPPPCSDCIRKGLNAYFVPELTKLKFRASQNLKLLNPRL